MLPRAAEIQDLPDISAACRCLVVVVARQSSVLSLSVVVVSVTLAFVSPLTDGSPSTQTRQATRTLNIEI